DDTKIKKELNKSKIRVNELDRLIENLFEQYTLGNLTEERFLKMSRNYEEEQTKLDEFIQKEENRLKQDKDNKANIKKFVEVAKKYSDLKELNHLAVRELIDKIVVHEKIKSTKDKSKSQQVDIYYNFIGLV
ncbi:MAG: DUF4368 domain-containing protein, partial [Defluviitaleaceae bacterium]|nr:DUF4368 domain-containing protein [Defluviitaleaceae bacterium]